MVGWRKCYKFGDHQKNFNRKIIKKILISLKVDQIWGQIEDKMEKNLL